jgi:prevent-host-death family protein
MDAGRSVQATQAKNRFGAILKSVRQGGPVFIEKHGTAQAVVLDVEAYRALLLKSRTTPEAELDTLRAEFQALSAQMQTEKSRKAVQSLFTASAEKLNRTAGARLKPRT